MSALGCLRRLGLRWIALSALVLACDSPRMSASGSEEADKPAEAAGPEASAPAQGLVLMTLNAEFLWDGEAPEDGDVDFPWRGSPKAAEAHMEAIAKIVRAQNPDILQLVEVEDERALETFRRRHLGDAGYTSYFVEGTDTATGQDMALLSRVPILTFGRDPRKGRSGTTSKAVSKNYVATLDVGSLKLGLVGIHLLSGPTRHNRTAPREAQADAVRTMARDLAGRGRSVIVWGDFNDFDGATLDRAGSRPISHVLAWIRAMDPANTRDDLWNVAERLPQGQRYTHYGRDRPAIDHVLLSPDLVPRVENVEIAHREGREGPTPHAPIVVTLRVP